MIVAPKPALDAWLNVSDYHPYHDQIDNIDDLDGFDNDLFFSSISSFEDCGLRAGMTAPFPFFTAVTTTTKCFQSLS